MLVRTGMHMSVILLFFALLLAGCGGAPVATAPTAPAATQAPVTPTSAPNATAPTATGVPTPKATAPTATGVPTPKATVAAAPHGTLRFGFLNRFLTWDPHQEQRPIAIMGYQLVYDALVNEDSNGGIVPGLATAWTQTATSVEFTLREGVVFHDGTSFDAAAAKANLLHARDNGAPTIKQQLTAIEDVAVIDATHIRLKLTKPVPDLLNNLARMAGMMISPTSFATAKELPVGTGPWVFNAAESKADAQYVFDAFPRFWDPQQQQLQRIVLLILPDQTSALNALRSGEIDAAPVTNPSNVAQLQAEGYAILANDLSPLGLQILDRNGTIVPAFADKRVRLALSYAIDRQTLIDTVLSGYGKATTQRSKPGQYGYANDIVDLNYNPARARALLAEAGVQNLEFSIPSGGVLPEAEAIVGFFKAVGVTMKLEIVAPGTVVQEAASGKWPAVIVPLSEPHIATFIANRVLKTGSMNPFRIEEPDLEALAAKARTLPPAEAEPLWAQLSRETAQRGIIVNFYTTPSLIATSPKVKGGTVGYFKPSVLELRGVAIED